LHIITGKTNEKPLTFKMGFDEPCIQLTILLLTTNNSKKLWKHFWTWRYDVW